MFAIAYNEVVEEAPHALRARERHAMTRVIDMLREAQTAGVRSAQAIEALHYLRSLWSIFLNDLNDPGNELPAPLRAGIISIGIWMNREIDRLRSGASADLTPLIEINEIIRDGLA